MKSIVGKSVTVVLLLAVAGGLAAWLVFGDKISAALSGEPQTVSPLTAPVERGSVQQTVTGVGEVKPLETVKLRPADSWHWLQSFDAPLNKRVAAGETLVTYANGEKWAAPYDLVVTSRGRPLHRGAAHRHGVGHHGGFREGSGAFVRRAKREGEAGIR